MHSSTGDKIADEIKELRKVLQDIRDLLRDTDQSQQIESANPFEITIKPSVFDNEYLLRGKKSI